MRTVPVVPAMMRRYQAAIHELRCVECRVTWRSWAQRVVGNPQGMTPRPPANAARPAGDGGSRSVLEGDE